MLNILRDNPGARRKKILVGRGIGSSKGKTCGRGGKGQTARSGVRLKGFQGGQMPLSRRLPKRGFTNIFRKHYRVVNVYQLQEAVDAKRLDATQPVTAESLVKAGFFKKSLEGVRILGTGSLTHALEVHVAGISATAQAAIHAAGGKVVLLNSQAA